MTSIFIPLTKPWDFGAKKCYREFGLCEVENWHNVGGLCISGGRVRVP